MNQNINFMTITNLIAAWKADFTWVGEILNPFLEKKFSLLPDPVTPGEFIIEFSIIDTTLFVNGKLDVFYRNMQFRTFAFGQDDPDLNKGGDASRLKSKLERFTREVIQERERQIREWSEQGLQVTTSNPLQW